MGGRRKFIDKLQMVFDEGLYDPANEPDIAYAYLFSRFRGEDVYKRQVLEKPLPSMQATFQSRERRLLISASSGRDVLPQ